IAVDGAAAAAGHDVGGALGDEELDDGVAGGADTCHNNLDVLDLLLNNLQGVGQGRKGHDGRAVLVVVENRDVQLVAEALFNFEAAGGCDVLEVDAAVNGGHGLGDHDDLFRVLGVQADRPGVN